MRLLRNRKRFQPLSKTDNDVCNAKDIATAVEYLPRPRRCRGHCCRQNRQKCGRLIPVPTSHLVNWRRERHTVILKGLTPPKRGPRCKCAPLEEQSQELHRENPRLTKELRKAKIAIDVTQSQDRD